MGPGPGKSRNKVVVAEAAAGGGATSYTTSAVYLLVGLLFNKGASQIGSIVLIVAAALDGRLMGLNLMLP